MYNHFVTIVRENGAFFHEKKGKRERLLTRLVNRERNNSNDFEQGEMYFLLSNLKEKRAYGPAWLRTQYTCVLLTPGFKSRRDAKKH